MNIGSWVLDATPGSKDSITLYDKMEEYSHGATDMWQSVTTI